MLKSTKDGIKRLGPVRELSEEDRKFIRSMFDEYENYEKPLGDQRDPFEDELYDD